MASLDEGIQCTLQVAERTVKFGDQIQEMFSLCIEIMQACLDECKIQYRMFVKTLKSSDDQSADREEIQKKLDDLLKIENAVLNQFDAELGRIFGKMSRFLVPAKPRAMVQNIKDIRRLLWTLLNSDCV